jgi:outer membrane lipoprotein-sorting protein
MLSTLYSAASLQFMRCSLLLLLAAAMLLPLVAPARADDPQAVLKKAEQAQLKVPAMRMDMVSVDHVRNKTTTTLIEIVNPAGAHMKSTVDGKITSEVISDGQKAFIRQGDGDFHPLPGNIVELMTNARKSAALEGVAEMATDVQQAGHEDVNGTPCSIYTFKTNAMGLTGTSKIWISDHDGLPVKGERHTQGETKLGASPGVKVDRDATITFSYDPSIKITLPGS